MRKLLDILARRFPPRLTVTERDWTELRQEVAQLNVALQAIPELHKRLQAVERNLDVMAGTQGLVKGPKGFGLLER